VLEIGLALAAGAAGAALVSLALHSRATARARQAQSGLEARLLAAEGVQDELRKQVSGAELEVSELRAALDRERTARADAEGRLGDRERLVDAFRALSGDALRSNSESFLQLARQTLETVVAEARGDLDLRQHSIGSLVQPLAEALGRYDAAVRDLERARERAHGNLEAQLKTLADTSDALSRQTGTLVTALRTPHVRGRWGEVTLQRVVELAGMSAHCDYGEQVTVESEAGRRRPDLIVRLPGGRHLVVDAKVPLVAYLEALEAPTDLDRRAALERHARQVRAHMAQLAARAYWEQLGSTPDMVVMFIPAESFFAAAVDLDRTLIEDGMERRVVLATPTTLVALLRAVAHGWRQEQLARNATVISELGKQLYDRLRLLAGHLEEVGKSIGRSVEAYNRVIGSLESRVFPAARRFQDLGAAGGDAIPALRTLDETPRPLNAPDVPRQLEADDFTGDA
jgi:DNA recombination protein RmuC